MSELLLIDDDQELCELLGSWLTQEGFAVRACHDGQSARQALATHAPAAVVLDVMLPDGSGLELLKQLRSEHTDLPVLMLSARGEPLDRILGLELGADDYLAKPFSPRELAARIKALLRRAAMPAPAAVAPTPFVDDETGQRITLHGQALPLTRREYRLLSHLLRGAGRIHSRDALLAAAWGDDSESTDRTVDTHIKTLRAKLREVDAGREYISTHRGMGYCLDV